MFQINYATSSFRFFSTSAGISKTMRPPEKVATTVLQERLIMIKANHQLSKTHEIVLSALGRSRRMRDAIVAKNLDLCSTPYTT